MSFWVQEELPHPYIYLISLFMFWDCVLFFFISHMKGRLMIQCPRKIKTKNTEVSIMSIGLTVHQTRRNLNLLIRCHINTSWLFCFLSLSAFGSGCLLSLQCSISQLTCCTLLQPTVRRCETSRRLWWCDANTSSIRRPNSGKRYHMIGIIGLFDVKAFSKLSEPHFQVLG